uniref:Choline transporter-like protein n=1 Tax=Timema californicum TaxID=61474 RepID=A0A7R9PDJ0_TIMCA|nr:unnamed protein product [Timema californicum]
MEVKAFDALVSNALNLATVNSVGDFILFLGKCIVTAVTGFVGLLLMKQNPHLHFYATPTLFICIFAFFIAHSVISLYEIVIDTMFLCKCEGKRLYGDDWEQAANKRRALQTAELTPMNNSFIRCGQRSLSELRTNHLNLQIYGPLNGCALLVLLLSLHLSGLIRADLTGSTSSLMAAVLVRVHVSIAQVKIEHLLALEPLVGRSDSSSELDYHRRQPCQVTTPRSRVKGGLSLHCWGIFADSLEQQDDDTLAPICRHLVLSSLSVDTTGSAPQLLWPFMGPLSMLFLCSIQQVMEMVLQDLFLGRTPITTFEYLYMCIGSA